MGQGNLTLAIETSNPSAGLRGPVRREGVGSILAGPGVAVGRSDPRRPGIVDLIEAEALRDVPGAEDDLGAAIDRLFRRISARPTDLGTVAVSIGPGGYTALRIAIATTKMIAHATGATVVPVPSAFVAAWCASPDLAPAIVCIASKGDTTHGTLLPPSLGVSAWWEDVGCAALRAIVPPEMHERVERALGAHRAWIDASCALGLITAEHVEVLRPSLVIADRFLPGSIRSAGERLGARFIDPLFAPRSVLELSARLPPVDPIELSPLYPREPEAVTLWRARRAGA